MLSTVVVVVTTWLSQAVWANVQVDTLRCEYLVNPLGIDAMAPRLSWIIESDRRGEVQKTYQVLVASTPELLQADKGDLWDSGKIKSDQSIQIEYRGKPLTSQMRCHWKVRIWDRDGTPSAWSEMAFWSMGLLKPENWQAHWIGHDAAYKVRADAARDDELFTTRGLKWVRFSAANARTNVHTIRLRKSFNLPADRKIRRAVFVLYADNMCDASVNGFALGQAVRWDRAARLDATSALDQGANVAALVVQQSDYLPPAVVGKLVVQFVSGEDVVVPVDQSWKVSAEDGAGWQRRNFDDHAWAAAEVFDGMPWRGPASVADVPRIPAPYLRKDFTVNQPVTRATVYVTALGLYELHLNGKRVGQDQFAPGWTDYRKRVQYQTYDVTGMIQQGGNALGAILGDGWYAGLVGHIGHRNFYGGNPRLLVQLVLELMDRSKQIVISDGTWKAAYGPIRHADLLMGCEYDTRLALPGWDVAGFDDSAWAPVLEDRKAMRPELRIQAAVAEPSRCFEELPARVVTAPAPGLYTFDLGQNMVGWVRLRVRGLPGQRITVRHGEMLNPDGTVYTSNLRSATATDFYELSGQGEEVFEPYFTFHGFRYVEVRGLTAAPGPDAVTGIVVHSALRRTGDFVCSNPLVNQLYHNIIWGQLGNHLEVPTDCPQRDERLGWTGDTQFFAPTGAYNFDVAAFFTRWLTTMCEDSQNHDGSFPLVIPNIMDRAGATGWSDAAILCTYNTYRYYGDTRLIAAHFSVMDNYMKYVAAKSRNFIPTIGGPEDWLNLGGGATDRAIDTAYYAHLAALMAEMAHAIDQTGDAHYYDKLHHDVQSAFVRHFVLPDGSLKDCSQTGYTLAFTMDLLPADLREKAAEKFVEQIKRFDWHLATGFIGTPRILPSLHAAGRDDVAYRLLLQETYPSWLYQVKLGATTMWERWNGWTPDHGFADVSMNSFNHYAFGSVGQYLYSAVGGINAASPGFKTIRIQPVLGEGLTWAQTSFDSMYGKIATRWERNGGKIILVVTIPANTTATVYVPAAKDAIVTESGKPAETADGVKFIRAKNGAAIYEIGFGTYKFVSSVGSSSH